MSTLKERQIKQKGPPKRLSYKPQIRHTPGTLTHGLSNKESVSVAKPMPLCSKSLQIIPNLFQDFMIIHLFPEALDQDSLSGTVQSAQSYACVTCHHLRHPWWLHIHSSVILTNGSLIPFRPSRMG